MTKRRLIETLIALVAVVGVVGAIVVAVVVFRDDTVPAPIATPTTPPPTTTPTTTTTKPPKPKDPRFPAALVVKIDSVSESRPHTGLYRANAIFVEPVEGGYSRMLAMYWGKRPSAIGPVRSARETDIELLAQFKKPVLSFSGAASQLKGALKKSSIVLASPDQTSGAYYRNQSRPSPHNMFVNPAKLPSTKRVASPLPTGAAPEGGKSTKSRRVSYQAATYDFTWSKKHDRWLVSQNGSPLTTTEKGRMLAGTVVVQRVRIVKGLGISDFAGSPSPVARTVGKGRVTVLRDGKAYQGKWSRSKAKRPTTYETTKGKPLRFAKGKVWVLLVPE